MSIKDRALHAEQVVDEEVVRVNVGFQINGTSNPDATVGDELSGQTVTRAGAGHFTFTLNDTALSALKMAAYPSMSGGTTDLTARVDSGSDPTAGTYTVWTLTGATATDPPDNSWVYVELVLKTTARKAIV